MNEFELINLLTRDLPRNDHTVVGPGDDCAVIDVGLTGQWLLFKTDAVVEGIHYTRETPPEKVGHKALARCLSDIAAMAGTPLSALVTLALPRACEPAWPLQVYSGLNALARRHQVAVVGGETTTNPDRTLLSIAVLGMVAKENCPLRSGAKPGDALFVTGDLGGSIHGRHLDFEPRLAEARWLAAHFHLHALMDISDGLAGDLRHILKASGCGAELLAPAIPISRAARQAAGQGGKPPLSAALSDGEDFELLFTVASRDAVPLVDAWKQQFPGLHLGCIGRITSESGLKLRDKDRLVELSEHGYEHFA